MDYANGQRAAVNVEYILLIVAGAIAVVMGVGFLGDAMNDKHIAVAEALNAKGQQVAGSMTAEPTIDNGDGTYAIAWSGGTAPYTVTDATGYIVADGTGGTSISVTPEPGSNTYTITDGAGVATSVVVTDSLGHAELRAMGGEPRCSQIEPNDRAALNWSAPALSDQTLLADWSPLLWEQDGVGIRAGSAGGNLSLGLEPDPGTEPIGYPGIYKRIDLVVLASATGATRQLSINAEAFDVVGSTGSFPLKDQSFTVPADGVTRAYRLTDVPAPSGWDWIGALPYRDVLYVRLSASAGSAGSAIEVDKVFMDYVYE